MVHAIMLCDGFDVAWGVFVVVWCDVVRRVVWCALCVYISVLFRCGICVYVCE
jgi:hypothetical protein